MEDSGKCKSFSFHVGHLRSVGFGDHLIGTNDVTFVGNIEAVARGDELVGCVEGFHLHNRFECVFQFDLCRNSGDGEKEGKSEKEIF